MHQRVYVEILSTQEVWRAQKRRKSYTKSNSSLLSALQTSQVLNISKNARLENYCFITLSKRPMQQLMQFDLCNCLYQFYTHLQCKHESEAKQPPDFLQTSNKENRVLKNDFKTRQDIYYHNIVYNFLARSQPKTLVVPHQINILLHNIYYLIISEKQREKKRKKYV